MRTLTARYLSGRESIPLPAGRREGDGRWLTVVGAREHNLRNIRARIPLRTLTCVTGVSGSGKSTLVHDTLYRAVARAFKTAFEVPGAHDALLGLEHLRGVRLIDQEPIGRTPRSNPVTYIKAFDDVRRLFAGLPKAKALGLGPGTSVQRPRRPLRDLRGRRLREARDVLLRGRLRHVPRVRGAPLPPRRPAGHYQGRDISQVLQMTVDEAIPFFVATAGLTRRLQVLQDVGLGYLRLGQPATTCRAAPVTSAR